MIFLQYIMTQIPACIGLLYFSSISDVTKFQMVLVAIVCGLAFFGFPWLIVIPYLVLAINAVDDADSWGEFVFMFALSVGILALTIYGQFRYVTPLQEILK